MQAKSYGAMSIASKMQLRWLSGSESRRVDRCLHASADSEADVHLERMLKSLCGSECSGTDYVIWISMRLQKCKAAVVDPVEIHTGYRIRLCTINPRHVSCSRRILRARV